MCFDHIAISSHGAIITLGPIKIKKIKTSQQFIQIFSNVAFNFLMLSFSTEKMKSELGSLNKLESKFQHFHIGNTVDIECLQKCCNFLESTAQQKGLPSEMFCIHEVIQSKQFHML